MYLHTRNVHQIAEGQLISQKPEVYCAWPYQYHLPTLTMYVLISEYE